MSCPTVLTLARTFQPDHVIPQRKNFGGAIRIRTREIPEDAETTSGFELAPRDTRLPDDGPQGSGPQLLVIRHRNRRGSSVRPPLHNDMTSLLPYALVPVSLENRAHFLARQDTQLTQRSPQTA